MVIGKVALATGKWINGKWVKTATETVADTVSKGRWVKGKWIVGAQPLEDGRTYTKMKTATSTVRTTTSPVTKKVVHTRLPEGMLPEELTANSIKKLIGTRYNSLRHKGIYNARIISTDLANLLKVKSKSPSKGIIVESGATMWTYRKPLSITDNILDFNVLSKERISMSVNAHPDIINVLDSFIVRGEVVVNGKILRTVQPPKAYYKIAAEPLEHFPSQSDPITLYFRESVSTEQLEAIKQITEPFRGIEDISKADKLFHSGRVEGARWLSHSRENTPEDAYKAFKRAEAIDDNLAIGVAKYVKSMYRIPAKSLNVRAGYDDFAQMENYRYRISAGQQYAIDSFIDDYIKALGKTSFDRTV